MKTKTSELTGVALDWAVIFGQCLAVYNGRVLLARDLANKALRNGMESPSTDWAQGGEIIEREKIAVEYTSAESWHAAIEWLDEPSHTEIGPTALIAAMRCYVASRLGDEVDVPEELR